jgi:23S rRNA-/tRNA-specific pseudouridylate synthase
VVPRPLIMGESDQRDKWNTLQNTPLRVLYQDDDVDMVVKPQGMSVMGDDGMTLLLHLLTVC